MWLMTFYIFVFSMSWYKILWSTRLYSYEPIICILSTSEEHGGELGNFQKSESIKFKGCFTEVIRTPVQYRLPILPWQRNPTQIYHMRKLNTYFKIQPPWKCRNCKVPSSVIGSRSKNRILTMWKFLWLVKREYRAYVVIFLPVANIQVC